MTDKGPQLNILGRLLYNLPSIAAGYGHPHARKPDLRLPDGVLSATASDLFVPKRTEVIGEVLR